MTVKEFKEFLETIPEDAVICNRTYRFGEELICLKGDEHDFSIYTIPYEKFFQVNDLSNEDYIQQIKRYYE